MCNSINKKKHMRDTMKEVDQIVEDLEKCPNNKTIREFYPLHTVSIKAIGVNNSDTIVPSTRFSPGKMIMFTKLSLMSFAYELYESFMFPSKIKQEPLMIFIVSIAFTFIKY